MYEIAIGYTILVSLENHTRYETPHLQELKIGRGWPVD